jgi:uncharacterized protein YjbI with pentapeptide repeats
MGNDKKILIQRWQSDAGRVILQQINDFFFQLQYPGHGQSLDHILALIGGLPGSDDVPGGRDFRGIHLVGGVHELDFSGADFSYAVLEFNFVNCDLKKCVFDHADARGSILLKQLRGASFTGARLNGCFFQEADVRDCRFDQASLRQANFQGADLRGSRFKNAQCQKAKFLAADMRETGFGGANLRQAVLQAAVIDKSTDFSAADLRGAFSHTIADKSGNALWEGVDLKNATYDEATIF